MLIVNYHIIEVGRFHCAHFQLQLGALPLHPYSGCPVYTAAEDLASPLLRAAPLWLAGLAVVKYHERSFCLL